MFLCCIVACHERTMELCTAGYAICMNQVVGRSVTQHSFYATAQEPFQKDQNLDIFLVSKHIHRSGKPDKKPSSTGMQDMSHSTCYPDQMVEVRVGINKTPLHVHKAVLCKNVPYFAVLFGTDLDSQKTGPIDLSFVTVEGFHAVVHWGYTETLSVTLGEQEYDEAAFPAFLTSVLAGYKAADQLMVAGLQNALIDRLAYEAWDSQEILNFEVLSRVCENDLEHTPLYRYMLKTTVRNFVYHHDLSESMPPSDIDRFFATPEILKDIMYQLAVFHHAPWDEFSDGSQFHIDAVDTRR